MLLVRARNGRSRCRNVKDTFRGPIDGFTLMELMLVMAVLAGLAAFAAPSFHGMLLAHRLEGGAEQVRSLLRDGRRQAMLAGTSYRVDIQVGKGWIRLVPASDPLDQETKQAGEGTEEAGETSPSPTDDTGSGLEVQSAPPPLRLQEELPVGVRVEMEEFVRSTRGPRSVSSMGESELEAASTEAPAPENGEENEASLESSAEWTPCVEFFADGSATASVLFVMDGRDQAVEIQVEELIGDVSVSAPRSLEDWRGEQEESNGERGAMP
ncbi:MAG: prepilin-type N-terminal cleavage/methylation domain-containing protein [Planctomycetota bacterium]